MHLDLEHGDLMLVDKPAGWTSFNAVAKLRGALGSTLKRRNRVGHAGTLDPLATGLLLIGFGNRTKDLMALTAEDKCYTATLRLGAITPSFDLETEPIEERPWEHLGEADIRAAVQSFQGESMQRPPIFSAKRHEGSRAYFLAREGTTAQLEPRKVNITRCEVTGVRGNEVDIVVDCAKGTYIRSLAHDIGQQLGCGAHLSALRRTRIGSYHVADAWTPQQWSEWFAEIAKTLQSPQ